MERTRRDSVWYNTGTGCESTLTRFVWAGDQLLWELRVPGGNSVSSGASGLDATSASGDMYGRVSYFHAGGIDKPLLITKEGVESVVPRDTWRGQFHAGTSPTTGAVRDCQQGGQTGCLLIAWPGWKTSASHSWGEEGPDIVGWYGGLVDGMRDASGQMYMRNRYYDPATGQFTQTDPIGLAGGMNAYGFGAGDQVTYSDPYGLKVCASTHELRQAVSTAVNATIYWDRNGCAIGDKTEYHGDENWRELQEVFDDMAASQVKWQITADPDNVSEHASPNIFGWSLNHHINISPREMDIPYRAWQNRQCVSGVQGATTTMADAVAHELFGHGGRVVRRRRWFGLPGVPNRNEDIAMTWENAFQRAANRPARCEYVIY